MGNLTEEQKKEVTVRLDTFQKEVTELSKKYECAIAAIPTYVPVKGGGFATNANVVISDTKYAPKETAVDKPIAK